MPAVLEIENLRIGWIDSTGEHVIVDGVNMSIQAGEILGIVGESGSGKTLSMLAVLGLLPAPLTVLGGSIHISGSPVTPATAAGMRGKRAAMVFQDPMTSLNPVFTVGAQIAEAVMLHQGLKGRAAMDAAVDALRKVQVPDPERRAKQYPHELSGGMRQRVMIAMALACKSEVLLADEPTTALDVTVQAQILQLLRQLQQETGMAIAFITHDLAVVAELCDRVVVMYGGKVFESTDVVTLFAKPGHPYTQALLESLPDRAVPGEPLVSIPGQPPTSGQRGVGCPFKARCRVAMTGCDAPLPLIQLGTSDKPQLVACHRVSEVAGC